jgi:hypothetical protein
MNITTASIETEKTVVLFHFIVFFNKIHVNKNS